MLINTNHVQYVHLKDGLIKIGLLHGDYATFEDDHKRSLDDVYKDLTHDVRTKQWIELDDYESTEDKEVTKTFYD